MLPLRDVLQDVRDVDVTLDVIAPPYPCAGTGALRVVRVEQEAGRTALTAAYEGYDRL